MVLISFWNSKATNVHFNELNYFASIAKCHFIEKFTLLLKDQQFDFNVEEDIFQASHKHAYLHAVAHLKSILFHKLNAVKCLSGKWFAVLMHFSTASTR